MRLSDLFSCEVLDAAIADRLVVRREHPTLPLAILNYTERCQYERGLWSLVTMTCRGLIYNIETLEVVARPFRKFFNYGQEGAPVLDGAEAVAVTDKLDGSLGILYPTPDGYAIATRGAFESEQAQHATEVWRDRYANRGFYPADGWTILFEIVYPGNRIVLNYGDMDDLVLLGGVEIATGKSVGPDKFMLTNAEGLVIHFLRTDERVKVKQEDYVALHRIVTGLNERTVWEHLAAVKPLDDLLAPLPDEFHGWVREVAADLLAKVEADAAEVERAYSTIVTILAPGYTRKEFAVHAVAHPLKWALFNRLDGKEYHIGLWKAHYPEGGRSPRVFSEDTA